MLAMDADSVDAIVTDPPYGLEFMGQEWDRISDIRQPGDPRLHKSGAGPFDRAKVRHGNTESYGGTFGREQQEWHRRWASAAFRVLKPGGHIVVFGGARTYHRMACAGEDAGFEVRDQIQWLYGCLPADAQILTATGWTRGTDVQVGELVAQWENGTVTLAQVEKVFVAPYDGPMVVFQNHDVHQMVTPNHRVYYRRYDRLQARGLRRGEWSSLRVEEAASINRWQPIRLPVAGLHDGSGVGGEDYASLLGWVWTEGGFDKSGTGVRIYQSSVNGDNVEEIDRILGRLSPDHKRYDLRRAYKGRTYTETCWFFTGDLARSVRADLPGKRPTYDLLWRLSLREKHSLWAAVMKGDGSGCQFYQQDRDSLEWAQTFLAVIGQRGRVAMRRNRLGGSVTITPRPETELQRRHLTNAERHYSGLVWCVRVPSGAFLARYDGHIFVTGNSGFPKSRNVSKDFDRGVERPVVGRYRPPDMKSDWNLTRAADERTVEVFSSPRGNLDVTGPVTDDAVRWQGWGTALKPANEPILLARKPLSERNLAENVRRWGTGCLNIDACRISAVERSTQVAGKDGGRWPANIVLTHHPLCSKVGERVVEARVINRFTDGAKPFGGGAGHPYETVETSPDGTEDIEVWACVPECPVRILDSQSGGASRFFYVAKATTSERNAGLEGAVEPKAMDEQHKKPRTIPGLNDPRRYGAHKRLNFHPCVKPVVLMRYLCRLVTPPGGTVLDPFVGSGSTGIAAIRDGFQFVGIDVSPEYLDIASARMAYWKGAGQEDEQPGDLPREKREQILLFGEEP